jgi:hypothetical protein
MSIRDHAFDSSWLALTLAGTIGVVVSWALYGSDLEPHAAVVLGLLIAAVGYVGRVCATRLGGGRTIYLLIVGGILLRYVGSYIRFGLERGPYATRSDVVLYWDLATRLSEKGFPSVLPGALPSGTEFIALILTGMRAILGDAPLAVDFAFASLSVFGSLAIALAIANCVPRGSVAALPVAVIFWVPTIVYWTSGLGKDAWMHLALGVFILGATRTLMGHRGGAISTTVLGLCMAAVVRPHVAGIAVFALTAALMAATSGTPASFSLRKRSLASLAAIVTLLIVSLLYLQAFFALERLDDLAQTLDQAERVSQGGAGGFTAARIQSLLDLPHAALTVVARPLPWEAHNLVALVASLEMLVILGVLFASAWVPTSARAYRLHNVEARAIGVFVLSYTSAFVIVYSVVGNFGTLARMRAQLLVLLPFAILLAQHVRAPSHARLLKGQHRTQR